MSLTVLAESQKLILASGSTTRKRMLENAGVPHDVSPAQIDEDGLKESMLAVCVSPRDIADSLADAKARSVSLIYPDRFVLGADQVLEHNGKVLSKSKDTESATMALKTLSHSHHYLHSAAVIYEGGQPVWRTLDTAKLTVRPLSDTFIAQYLAALGEDAFWSVGAYQIEGLGAQLFEKIEGDYFTVLGMPLIAVLDFLRRREVIMT